MTESSERKKLRNDRISIKKKSETKQQNDNIWNRTSTMSMQWRSFPTS